MSILFNALHRQRENFSVVAGTPVYIPGDPVSANDMASLAAWFEVSVASAGITALNPATVTIEYSPDDGVTWPTLPGTINGNIDGVGANWNIQTSSATGVFPPLIRFKFEAPVGESYTVKKIRRIQIEPGYVAALRSSISTVAGFGAVTSAARSAAMLGSIDKAPVPNVTGYQYVTSTGFTKTLAGDGRAIDVNIAASSFAFSAQMQINYAGTPTVPAFYPATPASNKPMPTVQVAGDGLEVVTMGSGADSVLTPRVTLSTRHETVTTPVAIRIGDSTEFTTAHENYELNTQFVKAAKTLRLPVSANLNGWDFTNNTRKELRTDTNGDLQTKVMNFPTSVLQGNALIPVAYDYIGMNYAGATADVYTYKTGGAGGATVATLTVNYVDLTKAVITSVVRT